MPNVWLIDAYRAGERGQVRALVEALGWPYELKRLQYRNYDPITHLLPTGSLRGITPRSRLLLAPPWPDLVVTSGVRNEPVCRWIREQSGGRSRYVHVGKPWGDPSRFDLIVTTPQYRVPKRDNVVLNELTLHRVNRDRLAEAAGGWAARWRHLPRPLIAVMVGGNSGPFTLGPRSALRLGQALNELARKTGGGLLLTTSARTPSKAADVLRQTLTVPRFFHTWSAADDANPYLAMLGLADRFVVTADSIAMLSEACAVGKRVDMFDLGGMREGFDARRDFRVGGLLYEALMRWGWEPLTRDITLVHRQLVASGRAAWLGDHPLPRLEQASTDMSRATDAIRRLIEQARTQAGPADCSV
jgi:hypothetical protein